MRHWPEAALRLRILLAFLLACALSGCGALSGGAGEFTPAATPPSWPAKVIPCLPGEPDSALQPRSMSLSEALAEIEAAVAPPEVESELFSQLKASVAGQLKQAAGSGRVVSTPPAGDENQVLDLMLLGSEAEGWRLEWTYVNIGDYDLNGEVNISDLTPLGMHFGTAAGSGDWGSACLADGDSNGEINIADVTPIGMHYLAQLSFFTVYGADTLDGSWVFVDTGQLPELPDEGPFALAFPLSVRDYEYYRVVPTDSDDVEGIASMPSAAAGEGAQVELGTVITEVTSTIGTAGGSLQGPPGSPIEGVSVTFPEGAVPSDTEVSLGYNDGTVTPVSGEFGGVIIELSAEGAEGFDEPVEVTFPFTGTEDEFPLVYYVDDGGRLYPIMPSEVDRTGGTASFVTYHASSYWWSIVFGEAPLGTYDTRFKPGEDGFSAAVISTYHLDFGITHFAKWYFAEHRADAYLYGQFTDPIEETNVGQVAANRTVLAVRPWWVSLVSEEWSHNVAYATICSAIEEAHGPVQVYLFPLPGNPEDARCGLAYAYWGGLMACYDPANPGVVTKIKYNPETRLYEGSWWAAPLSEGAMRYEEPLENILADAKRNFGGSRKATIEITSHSNGALTPFSSLAFHGKVQSGEVLVTRLEIAITHPDQQTSEDFCTVQLSGDFTINTFDLQEGTNWFAFKTLGPIRTYGCTFTVTVVPSRLHPEYGEETFHLVLEEDTVEAPVRVDLSWDNAGAYLKLFIVGPDTGEEQLAWFMSESQMEHSGGELAGYFGYGGPQHFILTGAPAHPIVYGESYTARVHYYSKLASAENDVNYEIEVTYNVGSSSERKEEYTGHLDVWDHFHTNDYYDDTGSDWGEDVIFIPELGS